jgi:archaellum biogenesis ATPase FlaH
MIVTQLKAPTLKNVTMGCDKRLSDNLEEFTAVDVCLNRFSTTLITVSMGGGKTVLTLALLTGPLKKLFNFVYVVCPPTSLQSIQDSPLRCLPDENFFVDLTLDTAQNLVDVVTENASHYRRSLVIVDDCQAALKDEAILKLMLILSTNQRHIKCSTIYLLQNLTACAKKLRDVANNFIVFSVSKSQLETLRDETMQLTRKQFEAITKDTFSRPHAWLMYNSRTRRLFRGLHEEIDILSL